MNSTSALLPPFSPDSESIWVNALWFAALTLSLITASLGMLVKQWYREYLAGNFLAPDERCRVRYFRRVGLLWYKVPEIASFLPLLLQLSLALFFVGLVIYIHIFLPSICWHITTLIGLWFLFIIATTFIPIFSPSCPYKTPFLKTVFSKIQPSVHQLYTKSANYLRQVLTSIDFAPDSSYRQEDAILRRPFYEEAELARISDFDAEVLLGAYDSTKDINVWEMVTRCVDLNTPRDALTTFSKMVNSKFNPSVRPWSSLEGCYQQDELRYLLRSMTTCVHRAFQLACNNGPKYWFERTEADAVILLERLEGSFRPDSTSDEGLVDVTNMLIWESLSIPAFHIDAKLSVIPSLVDSDSSSRQCESRCNSYPFFHR